MLDGVVKRSSNDFWNWVTQVGLSINRFLSFADKAALEVLEEMRIVLRSNLAPILFGIKGQEVRVNPSDFPSIFVQSKSSDFQKGSTFAFQFHFEFGFGNWLGHKYLP